MAPMDAADLRIFEAVARLGGMNRAAAELHTVQSNVTARIRALEDDLGTPLFERHSRGVTLTPRGALTLGTLETTAAMRLSPLLATYVGKHPDVDLVLRTGTTCELVDAVL